MAQTMPCPQCGQPTSAITGQCPSCGQADPLAVASQPLAQAQPLPQPQPFAATERSNAGVLWDEISGFLEILALAAPIGIALVLIALGIANLLVLLPAFLVSVGIGAYNWRE